jgi:mono/diheme cytochrome c family protein
MKKTLTLIIVAAGLFACGNQNGSPKPATESTNTASSSNENPSYDPQRGEGKFSNVEVGQTIDDTKSSAGEKVYSVKCGSCHKLSDEKLVGPGWKGVSERRKPEWIMNFVTNPDPMIDKDPAVQAQLEICLVRMPNQNITDEEARNVYEFMRKNDSKK